MYFAYCEPKKTQNPNSCCSHMYINKYEYVKIWLSVFYKLNTIKHDKTVHISHKNGVLFVIINTHNSYDHMYKYMYAYVSISIYQRHVM